MHAGACDLVLERGLRSSMRPRTRAQPETKRTSLWCNGACSSVNSALERGCDKSGKFVFRSNLVEEDLGALFKIFGRPFWHILTLKTLEATLEERLEDSRSFVESFVKSWRHPSPSRLGILVFLHGYSSFVLSSTFSVVYDSIMN